jgi:hypothetical protein
MSDVLFILLTVLFFGLAAGYVRFCERLCERCREKA